jgi:O-antigen ligase
VHALRGAAWWDLVALLVWGSVLAVIRPRHLHMVRDGLLVGTVASIVIQVVTSGAAGFSAVDWGRVAGTTHHPNMLGAAMLLAAATLAIVATGARGWRLALALPALAAALCLALASGSRAVVVGAALAAAAWAIGSLLRAAAGPRTGRLRRSSRALAVLLVAVVSPLALTAVRGLPPAGLLTREVERAEVLSVAVELAAARPVLGHGGVPWDDLFTAAEPALPAGLHPHAHSVAAHLLVRGGAVGWALATLLACLAAWALRHRLMTIVTGPGLEAPLLAAAIGGLVLQGFVDLVVIDPAIYLSTFAWVAALTTSRRRYHPPDGDDSTPLAARHG